VVSYGWESQQGDKVWLGVCDSVQTVFDLGDKLWFHQFKGESHEFSNRTHIGLGNRHPDFAGTQILKLFRGCVFDYRGYFGTRSPLRRRTAVTKVPRI